MNETTSKVYVRTDDQNRIIRCEGGYTTPNPLTTDWVQIDDGTGDKYNLCQSHYFSDGLYTPDGIPRYKLQDGQAVEGSDSLKSAVQDRKAGDKVTFTVYRDGASTDVTVTLDEDNQTRQEAMDQLQQDYYEEQQSQQQPQQGGGNFFWPFGW